ncbi:MAG: hypothetical protein H5U20_10725 [Rhodobacteraceae bacterium]|nr:hypothetical protein [Paracoccaceae bacterium]
MRLIEETSVPDTALPLEGFRDHLRLGSGFGPETLQDGLLASYLRAGLAAVEARTGKALLARVFTWEVEAWRDGSGVALPVAPVTAVQAMVLADAAGAEAVVDPARYRLVPDTHRPRLAATGACLPAIPAGGVAAITFEAGFGADWAALPADLAQAVLLLAADYYETRHEGGASGAALPFGVAALVERWRNVRVLGGGAA